VLKRFPPTRHSAPAPGKSPRGSGGPIQFIPLQEERYESFSNCFLRSCIRGHGSCAGPDNPRGCYGRRSVCLRCCRPTTSRRALHRHGEGRFHQDLQCQQAKCLRSDARCGSNCVKREQTGFSPFWRDLLPLQRMGEGNPAGKELYRSRAERELAAHKAEMELAVVHAAQ
jgi:hypothetical protein